MALGTVKSQARWIIRDGEALEVEPSGALREIAR
jgi:hypothetical protein